jgi:hypothetical protein
MIGSREDIYQALFNRLSATSGFNSYWRKYPQLDLVNTAQMPALCMRQVNEQVTAKFGMPNQYKLMVELCIICHTSVSPIDQVPASVFNPLVDAVEAQLAPSTANGKLDFGIPNVSRVWIEGEIRYYGAISEDKSFIEIPISIVAV